MAARSSNLILFVFCVVLTVGAAMMVMQTDPTNDRIVYATNDFKLAAVTERLECDPRNEKSLRDCRRLRDIRALWHSLEIYKNIIGYYPVASHGRTMPTEGVLLGTAMHASLCLAGFTDRCKDVEDHLLTLDVDPDQPGVFQYFYRPAEDWTMTDIHEMYDCQWYAVYFSLETKIGRLGAGRHALDPGGIL